jgi:hypothetical protein
MSKHVEIVVLVEGPTEQIFIRSLLVDHLASQGIYLRPIVISKPGQKGGDVRFARVQNDIRLHLKQRQDTYLTLFVDYYGIRNDWPGLAEAKRQTTPRGRASVLNEKTKEEVVRQFEAQRADQRFLPYVSMHEFEALLFSEPRILAGQLGVAPAEVDRILTECGEPEAIDDSPEKAPSKRLAKLSDRFKKAATGIAIAEAIGLPTMRAQCPLFDEWLGVIEGLENF